jgi:hypothetical protein
MPDPLPIGTTFDDADTLRQAAATAVTAVPGVTRLEPTLSNALRRLNNATRSRARLPRDLNHSAADGIRLTRHGDSVDIHVDITTSTAQPAGAVARAVRSTLEATITAHHLTPGQITVSVLRLQP